jgi:predicted RNA-binding Zn ribbon-like protein
MNVEIGIEPSAYVFDLSGGRLCLDFTNTLSNRAHDVPQEHLQSYEDLIAWSLQTNIFTPDEAQQLLTLAEQSVELAEQTYKQAILLREALFRIFQTLTLDKAPLEADLTLLNTMIAVALPHLQLVQQETDFTWGWTGQGDALDCMFWHIIYSAAELLASNDIHSVKLCGAEDCNWLFLDASKNQTRRWCSMNGCGNRAKVRKHYERQKQKELIESRLPPPPPRRRRFKM